KEEVATIVFARDLYETHILESAEYYADRAKSTKSSSDYDYAIGYYTRFTQEYPFSPLVSQARFELAELLYFAGHYAQASETYKYVADDDATDEFHDEAAYGYLLSEMKKASLPLADEAPIPARDDSGRLAPPNSSSDQEKIYLRAA